MMTQWRVGPGGAVGLDYNVLPEVWRRTKTSAKDRDEVFADLQVMEYETLNIMRKSQK